jgi:hypothetical protein
MNKVKPVFGISVMLIFIYLLWSFVPPFFYHYQFQDFVTSTARESTYSQQSADDIRKILFKEAQSDGIPITADQINIVRTPNVEVQISVNYIIHVDIPFFPQDLNFSVSSRNKSF